MFEEGSIRIAGWLLGKVVKDDLEGVDEGVDEVRDRWCVGTAIVYVIWSSLDATEICNGSQYLRTDRQASKTYVLHTEVSHMLCSKDSAIAKTALQTTSAS